MNKLNKEYFFNVNLCNLLNLNSNNKYNIKFLLEKLINQNINNSNNLYKLNNEFSLFFNIPSWRFFTYYQLKILLNKYKIL